MSGAIKEMKRQGAELIDPVTIESLGKFDDSEQEVLLYELKADLNAYLAALGPGASVHSLKDIIDFNERNRDKEMPYFGQDLFVKSEAKGPLSDKQYLDALEKNHRLTRSEGIDAVVDKNHLDALIAPTGGPAWLIDLVDGDHDLGGSSSLPAVAGYPNINVPAGFVFGLPVGIAFVAVGTPVTRCPPHGSVREELPHTALAADTSVERIMLRAHRVPIRPPEIRH